MNGRNTLMLGLSFNNLDRFRAEPGDTFIKINGKEMNLPIDVIIFSGKTEMDLHEIVEHGITPDTIIHIDPRMKS